MRHSIAGITAPISKSEMIALTSQVKETLATDVLRNPRGHRQFGSIDLWNARRKQRTMLSMRRCR